MPDLQLPPKDAATLNRLAAIPLTKLQELFDALQNVEAGVYVLSKIADAVDGFAQSVQLDAKDIARVVRALNQTRSAAEDVADADFVRSVLRAVDDALKGEISNRDNLQALVVNILALQNIRLSVKATSLAFESQFHVHGFTIVSDLRPVFDSGREEIRAFFVANTLKIDYADDSEGTKTIFLSLDDEDLDGLANAIQNARKKKRALSDYVNKSGVRLLEMIK